MDVYAQTGIAPLPILQTQRLSLRPMAMSDADVVTATLNNFAISKWLSVVPFPYTYEDAVWFIRENLEGRVLSWSIFASDELIGNIGTGDELGYWLAPEACGKGYATEAGRAVVDYTFSDQSRTELKSSHFEENKASQHVLEKLGFEDVGSHLHHAVARGEDVIVRAMRLTRCKWQARADG